MKKICVIGGGKWGQNHIRTLFQMGNLGGIVETNPKRLEELLTQFPVSGHSNLEDAIIKNYDGYTVAAPVPLHYEIAKKLLEHKKNVLVEKPMTLSAETSLELVKLAKKNNVNLMVGHVLLFHPAIIKIKELIDSGKIGQLYYIYSNRLNLGTVRTEENVFWSLAPHDISVFNYITESSPTEIVAKGEKFLQQNVHDSTILQLSYPNNIHGHIFTSWLHPYKEHLLVIIGSTGMLSYKDSSEDKNIIFYNKHVEFDSGLPKIKVAPDEIIPYDKELPLNRELRYFVENLDKKIEISDGYSGFEVVKVLEKAQEMIDGR